jgi:hypothetical protein
MIDLGNIWETLHEIMLMVKIQASLYVLRIFCRVCKSHGNSSSQLEIRRFCQLLTVTESSVLAVSLKTE